MEIGLVLYEFREWQLFPNALLDYLIFSLTVVYLPDKTVREFFSDPSSSIAR